MIRRILIALAIVGFSTSLFVSTAEAGRYRYKCYKRCYKKCYYRYSCYYPYHKKEDKHPDQTVQSVVPTLEEDTTKKSLRGMVNAYRTSKGRKLLTQEELDTFLNQ